MSDSFSPLHKATTDFAFADYTSIPRFDRDEAGAIARFPSHPTVAVVGATGYLGRSAVDALAIHRIPTVAVHRDTRWTPPYPARSAVACLEDPDSLRRAFCGVDAIIHAASYIGSVPTECIRTNVAGTAHALSAAIACGARTFIYFSTVGVYGDGPHTVDHRSSIEPRPVTELSRSRYAAERLVLEAGGTVLRLGFVHGRGDKTFLPGLARIISGLGVLVNEGRARQSVVSIGDVGRVTVGVLAHAGAARGQVLNVCSPAAVRTSALVDTVVDQGLLAARPTASVSFDEALVIASKSGLTPRHVDLVGHDHIYDEQQVWALTGLTANARSWP